MSLISSILFPTIPVSVPIVHIESYTIPTYDLFNRIDLGKDPEVQEKIAKYFTNKLLDKWLIDFIDVLSFVKVHGNKVELINDVKDYDKDSAFKDSAEDKIKKIDFLQNYFITREKIRKVLSSMVKNTEISWVKLQENSHDVKKVIKHYLKKKLMEAISEKKN